MLRHSKTFEALVLAENHSLLNKISASLIIDKLLSSKRSLFYVYMTFPGSRTLLSTIVFYALL